MAAIGLDESQIASIKPLCGEIRPMPTLHEYVQGYSWAETDIMVTVGLCDRYVGIDGGISLMALGPTEARWNYWYEDSGGTPHRPTVTTDTDNTERELGVNAACPEIYRRLAHDLSAQLGRAEDPPDVVEAGGLNSTALIETTSGKSVALRIELPDPSEKDGCKQPRSIALLLPESAKLAVWLRAFLSEIHESYPERVPQAPPRLSKPSDWYTPDEMALADRIAQIESDMDRLRSEGDDLQARLEIAGENADRGIRRALWSDGNELVAAAREILVSLGFTVHDMDSEVVQGEPKREDLRLTLQCLPDWEAIVEVKGYGSGVKTSDSRQIREHRDSYVRENDRIPDMTVWLSNPYRGEDPSSRTAPDQNVEDAAASIGAVHVLVTDLYSQWVRVSAGNARREDIIQSLVYADPGLWTP